MPESRTVVRDAVVRDSRWAIAARTPGKKQEGIDCVGVRVVFLFTNFAAFNLPESDCVILLILVNGGGFFILNTNKGPPRHKGSHAPENATSGLRRQGRG